MKIEVRNFGKIKKGQVDLDKKVTVFAGYNNTGKTYMAHLLWAFEKEGLPEVIKEIIEDFYYLLYENGDAFSINLDYIEFILDTYCESIREHIPGLFNVSSDSFPDLKLNIIDSKVKFENIKSSKYVAKSVNTDNYIDYLYLEKEVNSLEIKIKKCSYEAPIKPSAVKDEDFRYSHSASSTSAGDIEFDTSLMLACDIIINLFNRSAIFLPANSVFFSSYYKYIYSVAKEEKDLIDKRLKNNSNIQSIRALAKSPYTKPTNDLIEKIYELNTGHNTPSNNYEDLLNELKGIIGGDIVIKSAEGIAPIDFYLKLEDGTELDMYMSSSSANQLTLLYLYLKYWAAEKNNYLIIDEPEENLDPENQIKLVNLLMKFADRNNNKILITTHSPLIADVINNYANLSYLTESGADISALLQENAMHIVPVENIKHSDYGIYFFSGEEIKEYEVGDYGAYFKDFQMAEDKVKDMSNILRAHIFEKKNADARK